MKAANPVIENHPKKEKEFGPQKQSKRVTARIIAFPIPDIYYRIPGPKNTFHCVQESDICLCIPKE